MQTARRLYLYLLSAAGLAVAAIGLWNLLTLAFARISSQAGGAVIGTISEADTRSQLSLALALVAVAGPLWAIHWWFVGRGVHSTAIGEAERTAPIRAFYLAIVELVALGIGLLNGTAVVTSVIRAAVGRPAPYGGEPEGPLAAVLVGGAIWAFHAWIRQDDERVGPLRDSAAWWPRLSRYLVMAAALVMLCSGAAQLIQALLDLTVGRSAIIGQTDWWVEPVVGGFASILVGGASGSRYGSGWTGGSGRPAGSGRASAWRRSARRSSPAGSSSVRR